MTAIANRAIEFVQSIGVCAHIDDSRSSYATSNVAVQMSYLGITNMRVEAPYTNLATYTALGQLGISFDVISSNTNLVQQIGYLNSIAPYVAFAEGPNEVNTTPVSYLGLSGAAAADAYQADFYKAVHADPLLAGAKVLPFSLSVGGAMTGYGNVAAYADDGNVHGYASGGTPPLYMLSAALSNVTTTPGKSAVVTETGYYTLADGRSGVTADVQAKWLMDSLLQDSLNGVMKTYLYQLEDSYSAPSNDPENHYGLYNTDGTPKQAAIDIHNLTTILADKGAAAATFTPGSISYTVSGLDPNYGFQKLYAKSNGSFDIALWSEPNFYNAATGAASSVAPSAVTIALGGVFDVNVFDPVTGIAAVASYTGVSSVQLSLGTDPLVVEVTQTALLTAGAIPGVTLGTGPDAIVVGVSEDAWQGNAQFTLQVDGKQIGGMQTTTASHGAGQTQLFTLDGSFGVGVHMVTATFLNDAWGGTATTDRNLYVDSISAGGKDAAASAALMSNGSKTFAATLPSNPAVSLGTGPDSIVVGVSEEAWQGDAQFTLKVDGNQIGGVQTTTALHDLGQSQLFTLNGSFGSTTHAVAVTFLNDAWGGTTTTDRNLFVDTVTAGSNAAAVNAVLWGNGTRTFSTALPTKVVAAAVASVGTAVALGAGADNIAVGVSEDAWQGDAQFTLQVDGTQIGGIQTATAQRGQGQTQVFTLAGSFGPGAHTVAATFLNDAWGGTPTTDRNLYLDSVTAGGVTNPVNAALMSNGSSSVNVSLPGNPAGTLGAGPDRIVVGISEDAWQGDAQFTLQVDGTQIGGVQTATALHGAGQTQSFTLNGSFRPGAHIVTATFLNDAWGGTTTTDRNLYLDSVTAGGVKNPVNAALMSNGGSSFAFSLPAVISPATLDAQATPTLSFIAASGAVTVDGGTAPGMTLSGGAGRNVFVLHAGAAAGDTITNFHPDLSAGDFLDLAGYGAGAALTPVGASTWQATSASGSYHDLFTLSNGPSLTPANILFT